MALNDGRLCEGLKHIPTFECDFITTAGQLLGVTMEHNVASSRAESETIRAAILELLGMISTGDDKVETNGKVPLCRERHSDVCSSKRLEADVCRVGLDAVNSSLQILEMLSSKAKSYSTRRGFLWRTAYEMRGSNSTFVWSFEHA